MLYTRVKANRVEKTMYATEKRELYEAPLNYLLDYLIIN